MKNFLSVTSKRTLASFSATNGEICNGFRGMSSCLSKDTFTRRTQDDDGRFHSRNEIQGFSHWNLAEQTRKYSAAMERESFIALSSNSTWMMHGKSSSPLSKGLSVRAFSDEKKSGEEETLPPPIPGDDGEEDYEFEDPNEAKHAPEDLDGDLENFTVPIVINMPDMNDDNLISTIEKWYKEPGDIIKRNDILCDIATPDFTFGMVTEDDVDAIMGEHHVKAGESAEDNEPICTIYHQPEP